MPRRLRPWLAGSMLAGALPLIPGAAGEAVAQGRVEVRALPRDSARSTQQVLLEARTSNPEDLLRMVKELQSREQRLLTELRTTGADTPMRRRLLDDLSHLNRERFTVLSMVESRCAAERGPRPAGSLGLNLETEVDGMTREVRFTVVHSVDPGSPAERAGVQSGDTLLSLGTFDMRRRLPAEASELLQPGNRLVARFARGSSVRNVTMTVAPRPESIARTCGQFERVLEPLRVATPSRFLIEDEVRGDGTRRVLVQGDPPREARPSEQAFIMFGLDHLSSPAAPYFAGAQFRALDDDWRRALSLKPDVQGVFVNAVAPGSAMAQAGLRKGDVVTSVANAPAPAPMALVNLLIVTERPETTLQVLRAGERLSLTLRLPPR